MRLSANEIIEAAHGAPDRPAFTRRRDMDYYVPFLLAKGEAEAMQEQLKCERELNDVLVHAAVIGWGLLLLLVVSGGTRLIERLSR